MIGAAPLSKRTGVPGWHSYAEEDFIVQFAQQVPEGGTIVHVGVEYGRCVTESAWAVRGKSINVWAVDVFPANHPAGNLLDIFTANIEEAGFDTIRMIPQNSTAAGQSWSHGPIDLLMIDAGHSYREVLDDINAWLPHVRDGGVILFHDYWKNKDSHPTHLDVKKAVDESFGEHVNMGPDSMVWVTVTHEIVATEDVSPTEDDLTIIPGIGDATAGKLALYGVLTIEDLAELAVDEEKMNEIAEADGRIRVADMMRWSFRAAQLLEEKNH